MVVLKVKQGISSPAVTSIPEKWDRQWFRNFITNFLVNADIRNVAAGSGITVSGNVSGNNTTGSSTSVIIAQSPVPSGTVMGNVSGISAVPIALTSAQLTPLVNLFTPTTSGTVPLSGGGTVNFLRADGTWFSPGGFAAIPNNTVLGNISGGTATAVALTTTQLTTLINVFTSGLSGSVPASGGGTTNFLRADGAFAAPTTVSGANPSAVIGLTAVNGAAATYLRSDGAPALSQAISPTWTGNHTFTPSSGVATTINAFSANTGLVLNGANTAVALIVVSGSIGATSGADISIRRAGSTANTIGVGASLGLADTTATTGSLWQHSGGQTELWQTQNNGATWDQVLKTLSTRGVVINAPASGTASTLRVNGVANSDTIVVSSSTTAGQGLGLRVQAGTNSSDYSLAIINAANTVAYFRVRGDGETFIAPNGTLLFTLAALTNNAGVNAGTLTNAPSAGNPTKWIEINDNGTIRSIPAW
jgi:hypothetical protein